LHQIEFMYFALWLELFFLPHRNIEFIALLKKK
jgi:hypothetical protein